MAISKSKKPMATKADKSVANMTKGFKAELNRRSQDKSGSLTPAEKSAATSRGRAIQKEATKASTVAGKSSATAKSIADRKKAEKTAAKTKARITKQGSRMASKAKSSGGRGRAGGLSGTVGGKPGLGKNPLNM